MRLSNQKATDTTEHLHEFQDSLLIRMKPTAKALEIDCQGIRSMLPRYKDVAPSPYESQRHRIEAKYRYPPPETLPT